MRAFLMRYWDRWRHASLTAQQKQQAAHWLPVSPVHLIADRDTLLLAPRSALVLSQQESDALVNLFNQHFSDRGYRLLAINCMDWWLGSDQLFRLGLLPLRMAHSVNLRDGLQQGADAGRWRQLLNEAQMLWFNDEVNQQRHALGKPEVNGIWPI
jgi:hypothetical protein